MPKTPQLNLTTKEIESLIEKVHSGEIDEFNLPIEYYYHVNFLLKQALYKGFEIKNETELSDKPLKLVEELKTNIAHFSAAKTFQQTKDMTDALTKDGELLSFSQFKKEAADIYARYNGGKFMQDEEKIGYLQTEYNMTVSNAQHCVNWERIEADKEVLPYVMRNEVEDENECELCEPYNNLTVPVSDPICNELGAEIHPNCRGFWEQVDKETGDDKYDKEEVNKTWEENKDNISPMCRGNSYKTREIFNKDTPAFDVPGKYLEFAKKNFGLPLD